MIYRFLLRIEIYKKLFVLPIKFFLGNPKINKKIARCLLSVLESSRKGYGSCVYTVYHLSLSAHLTVYAPYISGSWRCKSYTPISHLPLLLRYLITTKSHIRGDESNEYNFKW